MYAKPFAGFQLDPQAAVLLYRAIQKIENQTPRSTEEQQIIASLRCYAHEARSYLNQARVEAERQAQRDAMVPISEAARVEGISEATIRQQFHRGTRNGDRNENGQRIVQVREVTTVTPTFDDHPQ